MAPSIHGCRLGRGRRDCRRSTLRLDPADRYRHPVRSGRSARRRTYPIDDARVVCRRAVATVDALGSVVRVIGSAFVEGVGVGRRGDEGEEVLTADYADFADFRMIRSIISFLISGSA